MVELGKPFLKKSDWKNKKKENQCQSVACEQKTNSNKLKFGSNKKQGLEWTRNAWENHLEKIQSKKLKNSKNRKEIAACEQKTTSEKANFCSNTVFSLLLWIYSEKISRSINHSLFCSTSFFGVTKITTPIWPQKSWKCVNRS